MCLSVERERECVCVPTRTCICTQDKEKEKKKEIVDGMFNSMEYLQYIDSNDQHFKKLVYNCFIMC